MAHVLIAENQTLFRQMLRRLVEADSDFAVVAEAENGCEVIEKLQRFEIDVLVLDLSIPGISGIDLIIRAKALDPELVILVLSMHPENRVITQALRNGANGFISTMCGPDEFLNALRKVAGGGRYIDPAIAERMLLENAAGDDETMHTHLSQRELEVFRLLVAGKGVNEIADQLIISNKTVSSHKKNLMEKMHFCGMADLMRYAVQRRLFDDPNTSFEPDMQLLRNTAETLVPYTAPTAIPPENLEHELHVHQIELEMQNEQMRHTQVTLENSRDRYVDLYENAPVGYLTLSRDGLLTEINTTGATLLGADRKKILNRRFGLHVIPEDREYWNQHFLRTQQSDEKQTCELTFQRSDGTFFPARLDSQCRDIGESATVRIVLTDISAPATVTYSGKAHALAGSLPQQPAVS